MFDAKVSAVSAGNFIGVNNLGANQYSIDNLGLVINGNSIEQSGYGQIGYSDIGNSVLMFGSNIYNGSSNTYGLGINNDVRSSNQFFLGRDNVMRDTDSYLLGYNLSAESRNNFLFGYNNNTQQPDAFIIGRDVTNKWRDNIAIGIGFTPDKDSAIQLGITDPTLDIYRNVINIRNAELQLNGNPGNPGEILMSNGGGSAPVWNTASSLGSMNFSLGSVGSTPSITASASLGGTITLNIPNASVTATGLLRSSDWTIFNNKINLTSLSVTGGLLSYNNLTWVFGWTGTTTNITEWINLYFTNLRAQNALSGTVTAINSSIATATGNIATLTTNLATTNSNLATATGNIATLSWNLNTLSGQTNTNTTNISTLSGNLALTNTNLATLSWVVATKIGLTSLSALWPLTYNNTTGVFSLWNASTTTTGALTGTDWNTFNNKIGSLNGLTNTTQTFAIGTIWTDFNIVSSAGVHTFNIPDASITARGFVSTGSQIFAWAKTFAVAPTLSGFTLGSVLFAWVGWVISQNNAQYFWDTTNNRLGIGTPSPTTTLDISTTTAIWGIQSTNYGNTNDVFLRRAQGTRAAPTAILGASSILGRFLGQGYDGGSFQNGASISMETDAVPAAGSMPSRIVFSTSTGGSTTPTERMRINSIGYVGIGNNNPWVSLEVTWGIRARGGQPGAGGVNNNGYAFNGIGDVDSGMFSSADGQIEWYSNNVERMRLITNGSLGIGTIAPVSTTHISGWGAASTLRLTNNTAGNLVTDGFLMTHATTGITSLFNIENADMSIWTNNLERMRIQAWGNVGIGTITPWARLEINSGLPGTGGLRFTNLTSATTPIVPNGKVLTVDANGDVVITTDATTGTSSGVTTVAAFSNAPADPNGLVIAGTNISLVAANATNAGWVSIIAQTFGWDKTFANNMFVTGNSTVSANSTINGIGTIAGNAFFNGNTTIGNATTDRFTLTSQILGASPFVFQGLTDNAFTTTLNLIDPTANNILTLPNTSGTLMVDPLTTIWDMMFRNGANINTRLAIWSTGQILSVVWGLPSWTGATSLGTIGLTVWNIGTDIGVTGSPAALGWILNLNIPYASLTASGLLRSSDWNAFNSKIGSLNGLTLPTQTFAIGTSGTDFTIISTGSTHTFNLPDAGTGSRWLINTTSQMIAGTKTFTSNPVMSAMTVGSVPFVGSGKTLSENNAALFWNSASGSLGIGTNTPATTLQVAWDIRVGTTGTNGCIQGFGWATIAGTCSSDERLKRDVNDISGLLAKWDGLRVVNYKWNDQAKTLYQNNTGATQIGYLAQNVESLFPELVSTNREGYKQVNYSALSIYSAEAIRELSTSKADSGALMTLSGSLESLKARVDTLTGSTIIENHYTTTADTYVTTGSTVINNYTFTSTGMESTHDMVVVDQIRAETVGILDVYTYISSRITALFDVILEITVLKLTALRWYFEEIYTQKIFTREITTEKLCLKKSDATISCFSAEDIESVLARPVTLPPPIDHAPPPSDPPPSDTPPSSGTGGPIGSTDTGSLEPQSSPSGSSVIDTPPSSEPAPVVSGE
jgi:trimeric autotransporter adhesin